jgi:hypothetical protein
VFEKRVLRRIFGPKRDEVTGDWRKRHNEELRNFYSSPSTMKIIKKDVRACSMNGEDVECIQDIGGKSRSKDTTGKAKT